MRWTDARPIPCRPDRREIRRRHRRPRQGSPFRTPWLTGHGVAAYANRPRTAASPQSPKWLFSRHRIPQPQSSTTAGSDTLPGAQRGCHKSIRAAGQSEHVADGGLRSYGPYGEHAGPLVSLPKRTKLPGEAWLLYSVTTHPALRPRLEIRSSSRDPFSVSMVPPILK